MESIMASFINNLVQGLTNRTGKRKGEEKELAAEKKILIDKSVKVKNDGHKIIGWSL